MYITLKHEQSRSIGSFPLDGINCVVLPLQAYYHDDIWWKCCDNPSYPEHKLYSDPGQGLIQRALH